MPTRVWLMRHAETARPGVFHGAESDVDLSELGYRQAAAVAPVLAAYRPDAVVSSNMLRARMTATPIAEACGLPLQIEPDLHERRVGDLMGKSVDPNLGIWPNTLGRWIEGDTSYAPGGSESFDEIRARVLPVWERLTDRLAGKSFVVVAHGIVCRVLLLTLLPGHTAADWTRLGHVSNLAISELVGGREGWEAARVNAVPDEVRSLEGFGGR